MRTQRRIIGAVALILAPVLTGFTSSGNGDGNMYSIFELSTGRECVFDLHQFDPDQRGSDAAEELSAARDFGDLVPHLKFKGLRNEPRGGSFCI